MEIIESGYFSCKQQIYQIERIQTEARTEVELNFRTNGWKCMYVKIIVTLM